MKSPYDILVRPVITERALAGQEDRKWVFEVALDANKREIASAIEAAFGVKVQDVNTVLRKGKLAGRMGQRKGKKRDVKKAIVTLKEGNALEIA